MLWNQRRRRLFGRRLLAIALIASMVLNTSPAMAAPGRSNSARAPERPTNAQAARLDAENGATQPDAMAAPLAPLEMAASTPAPRTTANANANSLVDLPSADSRLAISAFPIAVTTPTPPVADGPDRFYDVPASLVPPGQDQLLLRDQPVRRPPGLLSIMPAASVPLSTGWNLISIPEEVADTDPVAVLGSIYGSYSQVYAYDACDSADPWKLYDPASSTNDLTSIDPTKGLWIEMTAPGVLIVDGTLPVNPSIQLCAGWNLVGYPRDTPLPVRGALAAIAGKYTTVFAYDPAVPLDPWLGYLETAPGYANDLDLMEPGKGYWIYATQATTLTFVEPGAAPTVAIAAPTEGSEVTAPSTITGTVTGADLDRWVLDYRSADSSEWIELASGATAVTNAALAEFDPTLLLNGIYRLRLTATHIFGQSASTELDILVAGQMKIGVFTLSFVDLAIPVSGIPIEIVRTYDSRDKRQHDFGVGWTLDIRRGTYTNNRKPGDGWRIESTGGLFPVPCAVTNETKYHVTEIRFSDVEFYRFALRIAMNGFGSAIGGGCQGTAYYEQIGGIPGAHLDVIGDDTVFWRNAGNQVYEIDGITVFEPSNVQLVTLDGRMFDLNLGVGLGRIEDPNGNVLIINENGVSHSSGKSISFDRDSTGRIVRITDPAGNVIDYAYDKQGDLASHRDREALLTRFVYDPNHNIVNIIAPNGITAARTDYDGGGRMVSTTDAAGNSIDFTHDVAARREVVRDRLGYPTIYAYDDRGNVLSQTNALGKTKSFAYDELDNLLAETDEIGRTTTYVFDSLRQLIHQTDHLSGTTSFVYNDHGKLLTSTDPLFQQTVYSYDDRGNLRSITDPEGNTATYTYDENGNLSSQTDAEGNVEQYLHDSAGNRVSMVDGLGNISTYTFDVNGNVLTETKTQSTPDGQRTLVTRRTYDANGNELSTIDPLGQVTSYEYDALGNRTAIIAPDKTRTEFSFNHHRQIDGLIYADGGTNAFLYDAEGRRTASTNREGETTFYTYDAVGRPISMIRADASPNDLLDNPQISVKYDDAGQITALINENNERTEFAYLSSSREMITRDPLGNETGSIYDAAGREIARTDALGRETKFRYDSADRLTETICADGTSIKLEYDSRGNLLARTDQLNRITRFEYDAANHLTAVVDAAGRRTQYTYDSIGNMVEQIDALGRVTRYEYDVLGRRTTTELPMGQESMTLYDEVGNIVSHLDFNGNTILYEYDDRNLLATKLYPDGTATQFQYTDSGKVSYVKDAQGITTFTYDVLDQLLYRTNPDGLPISYTYDLAGNVTSVASLVGTTKNSYDLLNRLETVTSPDGAITRYHYDAVGNLVSAERPNGIIETRAYDEVNRVTSLKNTSSYGKVIASYDYEYDSAGNLILVREHDGRKIGYSYDVTDRLIEEVITDPVGDTRVLHYTYDAVGNRIGMFDSVLGTTLYNYNQNDLLISHQNDSAVTTYSYDRNGNVLSETDEGQSVDLYTWDLDNQLTSLRSANHATIHDVLYRYSFDGERVSTTNGDLVTTYLVDSNRLISRNIGTYEVESGALASITYGLNILEQSSTDGKVYYLHDVHSGVRQLADNGQFVVSVFDYDAFGKLISQSAMSEDAYLFRGELFDSKLGNYYLRSRYYDASVGRFLSKDPFEGLPLVPISRNGYSYAHLNPVSLSDSSGLSPLTEILVTQLIAFSIAGAALAPIQRLAGMLSSKGDQFHWKGTSHGLKADIPGMLPLAPSVSYSLSAMTYAGETAREPNDPSPNNRLVGNWLVIAPGLSADSGAYPLFPYGAGVSYSFDCFEADSPGTFGILDLFGGYAQYGVSATGFVVHGVSTSQFFMGFGAGTNYGMTQGFNNLTFSLGADIIAGFSVPLPTKSKPICWLPF